MFLSHTHTDDVQDLALVLMEDSAIEDGGLSWLDHSWDQVKAQSPWRFMKPKCSYRMAPGNKMTQMALYMPYLNLGIHDALPTPQRKTYEDLLEDYATKVIHGSHTLDEFYYHSCEEQEDLRRDVISRNADQVLSKTIHGPIKDLTWWALVNVHQIWVWVIDESMLPFPLPSFLFILPFLCCFRLSFSFIMLSFVAIIVLDICIDWFVKKLSSHLLPIGWTRWTTR